MLKRMVARLLMFGIPFGLSYALTRPVPPAVPAQTFVICAYGNQGREIRIATDKAGCTPNKVQPANWARPAAASQPEKESTTSEILF